MQNCNIPAVLSSVPSGDPCCEDAKKETGKTQHKHWPDRPNANDQTCLLKFLDHDQHSLLLVVFSSSNCHCCCFVPHFNFLVYSLSLVSYSLVFLFLVFILSLVFLVCILSLVFKTLFLSRHSMSEQSALLVALRLNTQHIQSCS